MTEIGDHPAGKIPGVCALATPGTEEIHTFEAKRKRERDIVKCCVSKTGASSFEILNN